MKFVCVIGLLTSLFIIISIPFKVSAHEPHECPEGFPDTPAILRHIEQEQIANGELRFRKIFDAGQVLFTSVFNTCDGQGRPATTGTGEHRIGDQPAFVRTSAPDSNSCAGCHNQPRPGGGGDFVANVFVLAQALDPVTDSVSPELSDERNTLGMFGAGPIEMLGREMTADILTIREAAIQEAQDNDNTVIKSLDTKGVNFGSITAFPDGSVDSSAVLGVDADLVIKPFHQAGVIRSIREFTVNAMNHHHGMQSEERFDLNQEKGVDFDEDGIVRELTTGDITAVTIFQAALGVPGQDLPVVATDRRTVKQGELLFESVGCTSCHMPELMLESRFFVELNPMNPPGTFDDSSLSFYFDMTSKGEKPRLEKAPGGGAIVRPYTDLKRHNLCDDPDHPSPIRFFCNEHLAQGRPDQNGKPGAEFFITRKLWDVGNSAPYGHRGDLTTVTEAIQAHGGEARISRDSFVALSLEDQAAIVIYLKTLQILPAGSPLIVNEHSPRVVLPEFSLWNPLAFGVLLLMVGLLLKSANRFS